MSQDKKSGGVWRAQWKGYMGHLCHQHDCSVMCRHWQAAKERHLSWREARASITLSWLRNPWTEFLLLWMNGAREVFWAHMVMFYFSAASNQPRSSESSLEYEKELPVTSHFLVQQRIKKRWGRGNSTCFGHLCFVVILGWVSLFLLLTSRLLYVPAKKGDNVVGFPQSLLLSGGFSLRYCISGSGRSSGAWSGWDCWPEEMCVNAVTHCFQGIGNHQESQKMLHFITTLWEFS